MKRALASVAACGLMLVLAGCNIQPSSEAVAEPAPDVAAQEQAALAASARETHRACITTALNNTIYKQQTDLELEDALLSQNLDGCPPDFIASYVRLRSAYREYMEKAYAVLSHNGRKRDAEKNDWWTAGCSVIAGAQCAPWPSDVWAEQNAALRTKLEAAKATLEQAKLANETVIAAYGLYVSQAAAKPNAPSSADSAATSQPANPM